MLRVPLCPTPLLREVGRGRGVGHRSKSRRRLGTCLEATRHLRLCWFRMASDVSPYCDHTSYDVAQWAHLSLYTMASLLLHNDAYSQHANHSRRALLALICNQMDIRTSSPVSTTDTKSGTRQVLSTSRTVRILQHFWAATHLLVPAIFPVHPLLRFAHSASRLHLPRLLISADCTYDLGELHI